MGCNRQGEGTLGQKVDALSARLDSLELALDARQWKHDADRRAEGIAYLTPGAAGFAIVSTNLGRMTVELKNVEAYANGSRITLRFGNPLSAILDRVEAVIEYGTEATKQYAKTKEVTFGKSFASGSWTEVTTVLEGTPPSDLNFVIVRNINVTSIMLTASK